MRLPPLHLSRAKRQQAWHLPEAPTTWRSIREGMGPMRRISVPVAGVAAMAAALAAGAWWLPRATDPQRITQVPPHALAKLQPWLGGQSLEVPAGTGIWSWRQGDLHLVALRARADGPARTINLCDRRTGAKHDPASIYPVSVVSDLRAMSGDRRIARTPLVVPASMADGLPLLSVSGRAPDRLEDIRLLLQVEPGTSTGAGQWQVAMAGAEGAGRGSYRMPQEAWLLWSARPSPAVGTGPSRHGRAIRVRWQMLDGCDAGGLQWQLFDADSVSAGVQDGPATLWAMPDGAAPGAEAPLRLTVAAGRHLVPDSKAVPLEDKALFDAARHAGLLLPLPGQRLAIAPVDLFRAAGTPSMTEPPQRSGDEPVGESDARRAALLKALYSSANGSFVRDQVEAANQARHWLAIRVHVDDHALVDPRPDWRAIALGELLTLDDQGLPDVQARLFSSWPMEWGPWLRLPAPRGWAMPLATSGVPSDGVVRRFSTQLRLPLRPQSAGAEPRPLRLLLLGTVESLEGGNLLQSVPACHGPSCPTPDSLQAVTIRPEPGATALVLHLRPANQFLSLRPASADQLRVQWTLSADDRLEPTWVSPASSGRKHLPKAEVRVVAQDGTGLFESGRLKPEAVQLGLLPVLGLGAEQGNGVVGMLARLGVEHGMPVADATLTIEPRYQRLLHLIVQCMGGQGGDWVVAESRCEGRARGEEFIEPRREAHAVIVRADRGDIVAAASGARLAHLQMDHPQPDRSQIDWLLAFDRFNPEGSPLKPGGWVHYGGSSHGPGSTFKVLQALALERKAMSLPAVRAVIEGLSPDGLDQQARRAGYPFASSAGCYPAPCVSSSPVARRPSVQNFGDPPANAARYAEQGRLGLVQALRNSINTWFAFTGEWIDGTAARGHADAQGLGRQALVVERPAQAVMAQLGWEQRWQLDGGLLPADFSWRAQDVLFASASVADPFVDKHSVRQQAIGVRVQTTPLAMAGLAAAVATGRVVAPRLVATLNARSALTEPGEALTMPLDHVRAGLSAVVMKGTAASAFAAAGLKEVKPLVFGKTGSAPLANRGDHLHCKSIPIADAAPLACQNAAWFVGYLQPGAVPGEAHPLAFAVQITRTRMLGGGLAAPVMARWLEAIRAEHAASEKGVATEATARVSASR